MQNPESYNVLLLISQIRHTFYINSTYIYYLSAKKGDCDIFMVPFFH